MKKQVLVENKCTFYCKPNEDANHALVACEELRSWWNSYILDLVMGWQQSSLLEIVYWLIEGGRGEDLAKKFCMLRVFGAAETTRYTKAKASLLFKPFERAMAVVTTHHPSKIESP